MDRMVEPTRLVSGIKIVTVVARSGTGQIETCSHFTSFSEGGKADEKGCSQPLS